MIYFPHFSLRIYYSSRNLTSELNYYRQVKIKKVNNGRGQTVDVYLVLVGYRE